MWVWTSVVATNATEKANFIAFARSHGVREIFLSGPSIVSNPSALGSFTADVQAQNCATVELLFGDSSWALTANHGQATSAANSAVAAIAAIPGTRPVGLHFDVEPYLLAGWTSDLQGTANQYLDMVEKIAAIAHTAGLRLTMDIPFWFSSQMVTRAGATRPLSELVQDRVDRVALMDYRDTASAIIAGASPEVAYATKTGKEVTIGVETICGLTPTYITFCEEGAAALDAALSATKTAFAGAAGLHGFAVHHYGSYVTLIP